MSKIEDECGERDASSFFRCNKPGRHKGERHVANHPAAGISYTWGYVPTDDELDLWRQCNPAIGVRIDPTAARAALSAPPDTEETAP